MSHSKLRAAIQHVPEERRSQVIEVLRKVLEIENRELSSARPRVIEDLELAVKEIVDEVPRNDD